MKKRRGFTLAETVISFVLISIVVLMVGTALVSDYMMAMKLKELPNAYYEKQDEIETRIATLQDLIETRTKLRNEWSTLATGDTSVIDAKLSEVQARIDEQQVSESSVTLFGKSVDLYKFDSTGDTGTEVDLYLYATVVNGERESRPVPIINNLEISCGGSTNDVYHAVGATVSSTVDYDSKNKEYKWRETYQWYVCTGNFHAYQEKKEYSDLLMSTIFAAYPANFSLLAGERSSTITITESMQGHFICCVATPISKEGQMGNSVVSNFIYVSALPDLTSASYASVTDFSLAEVGCDETGSSATSGNVNLWLQSRYSDVPDSFTFLPASGGIPVLELAGSLTGSGVEPDIASTRFIRLSAWQTLVSSAHGWNNVRIFTVVRKTSDAVITGDAPHDPDFDFLADAAGGTGGFVTNQSIERSDTSNWCILSCDLDAASAITVKGGVDIAEILVVKPDADAVSDEDTEAVITYLKNKYGMN